MSIINTEYIVFQERDDIIEKVETFIQSYRALDYVIDEKGNSIRCFKWGIPFKLSYLLASSITNYELVKKDTVFKLTTDKEKLEAAIDCLKWIDKAIASGIIKPRENLIIKLKEYSERIIKLENDLKEYSNKNIELKNELDNVTEELNDAKEKIKEYEQMLPHFTGNIE